ncbi:MAG: TadE/TadG family type IV pilus assembly protein [Hyphomonas sp.]|uniref:TadE/TadG family type IV pilus assembly protein n=1 Tax=Hyphomonas sp. TaxID=87 RepID=UPI00349FE07B
MSIRSVFAPLTRRTRWRGIQGICYNEKGISAVEFALIAPLMVLIYFGCIELSLLMRVDRRVTTTASSLGDLTARLVTVSDADMNELFDAAAVTMQPYSVLNASIRITSVVDNGDGQTRVSWSDGYQMSAYAEDAVITVPEGLVTSPGSVIIAEVEFEYESPVGFVLDTSRTLTDTFYLRPRRVTQIGRVHD